MSKIFADNSLSDSNGYGDKTLRHSGFGNATGFGDGKPHVYASGEPSSDFEGFGTGSGSGYGPQIIYDNREVNAHGDGSGYSSGYGNGNYAGGDLDECSLCK
jgi:hypothetical protein